MTIDAAPSLTRVHFHTGRAGQGATVDPISPGPFHQTLPGHAMTPLTMLSGLATSLEVGAIMVKDEQFRLGLPSFKVLGGSWAINRLVGAVAGGEAPAPSWEALVAQAEQIGPRTLVTATDGNHGRGVARMANLLGFSAVVLVPDDMVRVRIDAIASEGAEVVVVDGDYDVAVAQAATMGHQERWHTVADVATEPGDQVPRWVMEGYATIFDEIMEQASEPPDALFIQAGVGSLAAAAAMSLHRHVADMRVAVVEPLSAACLLESAVAGAPLELTTSQGSMMAGLNCGAPSSVAWPVLDEQVDAFIAIDDEVCGQAMRALAGIGIVSGESGAAGLAGLMAVANRTDVRERLGLDASSRVLVLNTEGATDPANYETVVGRSADAVCAQGGG